MQKFPQGGGSAELDRHSECGEAVVERPWVDGLFGTFAWEEPVCVGVRASVGVAVFEKLAGHVVQRWRQRGGRVAEPDEDVGADDRDVGAPQAG